MSVPVIPPETFKRITLVDALRGFALFGIIIVHMVEQYYAGDPPTGKMMYGNHLLINNIIQGVVGILFTAKFFTTFSFLFGLSFFIQMDRAHRKGIDFKGRFSWRLFILFVIGFIHGLFYAGDILIIYAMLGYLLLLFYPVKDKIIWIVIILLISGLPQLMVATYQHTFVPPQTEIQKKEHQKDQITYYNALKTGSITDVFKINAFKSFKNKMDFQFGIMGRGYQTLALFLFGLLVGRRRYFENIGQNAEFTRKALKWFALIAGSILAIFILIFVTANVLSHGKIQTYPPMWIEVVGAMLYDNFNLAVTGIYITGFVLLYQKQKMHRVLSLLAPYGRMGLTSYVSQTMIGVTLLYGFGFGLLDTIGAALCFLIAIFIFLIQIFISKWWLTYFHYGPLEWFWRSATYLKFQPFLKKPDREILTVSGQL